MRSPRLRRPASYSGQLRIRYGNLAYLYWLRSRYFIGGESGSRHHYRMRQDLEPCTNAGHRPKPDLMEILSASSRRAFDSPVPFRFCFFFEDSKSVVFNDLTAHPKRSIERHEVCRFMRYGATIRFGERLPVATAPSGQPRGAAALGQRVPGNSAMPMGSGHCARVDEFGC